MKHSIAKELKERKLLKLVKKLQKEEDENWYAEQQRRLEQEEKDEAFARALQEQIASDELSISSHGTYTTTVGPPSPSICSVMTTPSLASSSPPPIPAKPSAYYSGLTSSSSSTSQRVIPTPPYQNGQPPLPPRERTVSQLSQYNPPLSQPSSFSQKPDAYHTSPNISAREIGYHSDTTHHIQHRDPVMFIIPQETTRTTYENIFYPSSTLSMPEPDRHASLQHLTTPPYDPSTRPTSTTPVSISQPMYISTSSALISSSYHSLAGTRNEIPGGATFASQTITSYQQQSVTTMKPDANNENENENDHPSRSRSINATSTPPPQSTTTVNENRMEESDDDDDDAGSMFWACNDGRMMASSSSTTTTHSNNSNKSNLPTQAIQNEKHLAATNDIYEEESGSDGDDLAIDLFDITKNDHIIIYQHGSTTHPMDNSNINSNSNDDDPFTDSFAVEPISQKSYENDNHVQINTHLPTAATPPPVSIEQYPIHHAGTDNDIIYLDDNDIQQFVPTNMLRAGAPPNIQLMMNQVTSEVPSHEFGYYRHQTTELSGEKVEVDDYLMKSLPELPKTHPDHRHITVRSVVENERVWIRVHPTDTGKSLASRIHIVATYKTQKILSIKTDKGRSILLDDTPVFQDWASVMELEDGTPWHVEWTAMENNPWEGPKEFLRYMKDHMHLCHD